MGPPSDRLAWRFRYAWALLRRFRTTFFFLFLIFFIGPLIFSRNYVNPDGSGITFGRALHHIYFLLSGNPSLDYVNIPLIEVLNFVIPPLGIATVVDGGVRFGYLFFAKHKAEKEWIEVIAESLRNHVVVCGAGRVGYRVAEQLLELKHAVLIVDLKESTQFTGALRAKGVPVLVEDIRNPAALEHVNLKHASAIICATNDDLANLNVALDARKINPNVRIVLRLFDDDLVARVRENFHADAHSTSALAAPAFALTALDPRIVTSFHVGQHLMVVSKFKANEKLRDMTIADLRDKHGGLTLSLQQPGKEEQLHPGGLQKIVLNDLLTVQCRYEEYRKLREFTGEQTPPLAGMA
jgi:Trk K+ transport system NAD-binding subunit